MVGLTSTEDRSEIAFFDVETTIPFRTGQGYAILEFGSILVCPKKLVELQSYSTLVKPANLNLITPRSVKCNGIKREDVASERSFADIAEDVYDILHGRIWAGHNILKFDCLRIREAFAAIGRDPPEPKGTIDSLVLLTQKFGRRAGDMKMATLAAYFGLGNQTHRSLDDVRMNFEVLKYCATVLFLESSLPDELIENLSTTPTTSSRRRRNIKTSPLQTTDGQQNGENSTTIPILSFVSPAEAQSDPFDMSRLKKEIAPEVLQSDILVAEEQNRPSEPVASVETSDQDGFVELDTISIPSIRAIHVPLYHGSQKEKIQLFLGDRPLRLHCPHQKVRFGISGKFLDNAGRRKLSFVVDLSPSLCNVLQECDSAAKTISIDSGSGSDWNPTVIQMKEFMNYPNARIHIPTELNGNVDWYAAEIHQRKLSGATSTQKLISSNPRVEELESSLNPGTVLDVFLSLEPYDYQQRAGIRLVARKLVIQESSLPDDLIENSFTTPSTSSRRRRNIKTSPLQSPDGQQTGENSITIPIPSFVSQVEAQSDPFDMSTLKRKIAPEVLQSDILMAEEQNQQYDPVAPEETIDQDGFVELDKIFIPSIRAVHVPFYNGSQKKKTHLFLGDRPLRLHCPRQKVRFGISGKFLDNAGRRKLSFVVDLSPSFCNVLQECDSAAKTISIDSGSGSDWNPAVIQMKEFMNYPNARIHIPTELNGDVDRYATEIHQRELSGATSTQKLISSNPSVEELESLLNPGIVLDIFLSLEPYDYQQRAGIRLVARKLVIH